MPWRSTHIKKGSHGKCWFFYSKVVFYKRKPDHRYHFLLSENEPKEKTQQTGIDLFLAEKKLNEIIATCRLPSLKEFKDPADTLEHRKKEIVNSFFLAREKRINNGPVKGRRLFDQEDISDQQQPFLLRKIPLPPAVFSGQKQLAWFRTQKEFRRTTEANEKRPASALLRRIRISCFLSFGNETRRQLKLLSPQGSEHYPLFGITACFESSIFAIQSPSSNPKEVRSARNLSVSAEAVS